MATQFANVLTKKSKRAAVLAVREEFKGKDLINFREFLNEGDDGFTPTKAGFTIPAEQFAEFFKAMRKFGKAAGLLAKTGDDDFEIKSLDELDSDGGVLIASGKGASKEEKKEKKEKKIGIVRRAPKTDDDDAEDTAKAKKAKAKDDDDSGNAFSLKAFKKAIKAAAKHEDDMDLASAVVQMYKANRKKLEDALPKHAVNALNKSLESKKDDALKAKAVAACQKHIVEKDFSL